MYKFISEISPALQDVLACGIPDFCFLASSVASLLSRWADLFLSISSISLISYKVERQKGYVGISANAVLMHANITGLQINTLSRHIWEMYKNSLAI